VGAIQLSYEISGEQQGTMDLNESTGWTIGAELKQTLAGKVTMGDISWPVSIDSKITMEAPKE